jgi:IclR family acetate operon transcriptional repressor
MSQAPEKGDGVRAVARALEILLAFTSQDLELTATELLARVDLSRPTLYRLLYTLEELGFVVSVGDPQKFRLGPAVGRLANVWTASVDLSVVAEPVLRRLWTQTQETVALFVPKGDMRLCVAELESPQPLSFRRGVGYTERIVRGASGRAMVAYMKPDDAEVKRWADAAGLDPKKLQSELSQTRRLGYAISHSELIQGAVAIAVPVFSRDGTVAGSIGVFGPEVRLNTSHQKQFAQLLVSEAAKLSEALRFEGDALPKARAA